MEISLTSAFPPFLIQAIHSERAISYLYAIIFIILIIEIIKSNEQNELNHTVNMNSNSRFQNLNGLRLMAVVMMV
jgi:hypothetical protein